MKELSDLAKPWAGRPLPESLRKDAPPIWDDPADLICQAMGGREFFFETGAKGLHRIGIYRGFGWRIPLGEARDYIDWVRIVREPNAGRYQMQFGKGPRGNSEEAPEIEVIREFRNVEHKDLRRLYDENTGVSPS